MSNPFFDMVSRFFSVKPKDVNSLSLATYIERDSLVNEVFGRFKFTGVPEEWDEDYMKERLFFDGMFCITDTTLGVIPLRTGITGYNVWEKPTKCIIANPTLGNLERTIDVDCVLVKLKYDYAGIGSLIDYYAQFLANTAGSINVNMFNTRVACIMECDSKETSQSYKKMYDEVSEGKPAVFVRKGMASAFNYLHPKESYIADKVYDLRVNLHNEFKRKIGIKASKTKDERQITAEVQADNDESMFNVNEWLECVNKQLRKANKMYGLNIEFILNMNGQEEKEEEEKEEEEKEVVENV